MTKVLFQAVNAWVGSDNLLTNYGLSWLSLSIIWLFFPVRCLFCWRFFISCAKQCAYRGYLSRYNLKRPAQKRLSSETIERSTNYNQKPYASCTRLASMSHKLLSNKSACSIDKRKISISAFFCLPNDYFIYCTPYWQTIVRVDSLYHLAIISSPLPVLLTFPHLLC